MKHDMLWDKWKTEKKNYTKIKPILHQRVVVCHLLDCTTKLQTIESKKKRFNVQMNKKTTFAAIKLMYVSYFSSTNIFYLVSRAYLRLAHLNDISFRYLYAPLHISHMRNKRLSIDFIFFSRDFRSIAK